jgi:hypothetical protein
MNDTAATLAQAVIEDGDVMLKSIAVWKGCLIGALALSVPFFRGLNFADKLALLWYHPPSLLSSPMSLASSHLLAISMRCDAWTCPRTHRRAELGTCMTCWCTS